MGVIAIDWDNTLMNGKEWLEGAKAAIATIRAESHKVVIHSANNPNWISMNLREAGIPVDRIWGEDLLDVGKPNCDLWVDDKGYHFPYNGDWNVELPKILERIAGKDNRKW